MVTGAINKRLQAIRHNAAKKDTPSLTPSLQVSSPSKRSRTQPQQGVPPDTASVGKRVSGVKRPTKGASFAKAAKAAQSFQQFDVRVTPLPEQPKGCQRCRWCNWELKNASREDLVKHMLECLAVCPEIQFDDDCDEEDMWFVPNKIPVMTPLDAVCWAGQLPS